MTPAPSGAPDVPGGSADGWLALLAGLDIEADVTVEIDDGGAAQTRAHLATVAGPPAPSRGPVLSVLVESPETAVAALPLTAFGRRTTRAALLDELVGSRWRVELAGPKGLLATIDPANPRSSSRLLTGSPFLHLTRAGVRVAATPAHPAPVLVAASGVVTLLTLAAIRWRRIAARGGKGSAR